IGLQDTRIFAIALPLLLALIMRNALACRVSFTTSFVGSPVNKSSGELGTSSYWVPGTCGTFGAMPLDPPHPARNTASRTRNTIRRISPPPMTHYTGVSLPYNRIWLKTRIIRGFFIVHDGGVVYMEQNGRIDMLFELVQQMRAETNRRFDRL